MLPIFLIVTVTHFLKCDSFFLSVTFFKCDRIFLSVTQFSKKIRSLLFFAKNQVSAARYSQKCVIQIYRDLYGDAMLVPIRMGTNVVDGNQQKHLSLSFATKA